MSRGLLLVETMRPKSPGLVIRPVLASMLPPEDVITLRLLIGLSKFTWLKRLKNSARNSKFFCSDRRNRLMIEKSEFACRGPRRTLRPTLPMSVPRPSARAVPLELGIGRPATTTGRTKANGLKKYPAGTLLVAVLNVAPDAQLGRASGLLPLFNPKNEPAPPSVISI